MLSRRGRERGGGRRDGVKWPVANLVVMTDPTSPGAGRTNFWCSQHSGSQLWVLPVSCGGGLLYCCWTKMGSTPAENSQRTRNESQLSLCAMETYGAVGVQYYVPSTLALVGGQWSVPCSGRFTPWGKSPWYPLCRRMSWPHSRSGCCGHLHLQHRQHQPRRRDKQ
jgi:hypothetical protein